MPALLVRGEMRLFSALLLAVFWLTVMATNKNTMAQAAGRHGCCTAFSRARAVRAMLTKGGVAKCQPQGITEGCNINAIVITWTGRKVCVDQTPRRMRKLLATLCTRKPREEERKPSPRRGKTKN